MPRQEQIRGIQSTKVMWWSLPFFGDLEKAAASMKKKNPRENCTH